MRRLFRPNTKLKPARRSILAQEGRNLELGVGRLVARPFGRAVRRLSNLCLETAAAMAGVDDERPVERSDVDLEIPSFLRDS